MDIVLFLQTVVKFCNSFSVCLWPFITVDDFKPMPRYRKGYNPVMRLYESNLLLV